MKPRKSTMLVALVVLLLAAFAIGMAQGTTQTDQKKKESCCAEGAKDCAEGADSCKHDTPGSTDSSKEGKSCCSGESCDMDHAQGDAKGGDAKARHKHGEGDCCKMKQKDKDKAKTKKTA